MPEFESVGGSDFRITVGDHSLLGLLFYRAWWKGDSPEVARDELLCAVFLYGKGYHSVTSHNGPPTIVVNSRPFVLPEDCMVYVLGPELKLQRIDVRAEEVARHFEDNTLNEYVRNSDWASKVQPRSPSLAGGRHNKWEKEQ